MAAFRSKIVEGVGRLKPDTLVLLLVVAWWVLNLLQAAFTGLADDEAYYWYFAQHLDWGYFDHPPMVALLVWLSAWAPGALGIRFFATLLQPLYLLIFWHIIRPQQPSHRDALLYALIAFSMPVLQLYGFLALPDAPLLFSVALFLLCFKRFSNNGSTLNAIWLGASVALMGYSKYHGALVVALAVLANPKMVMKWRLWLAAAVCLLLYSPHLLWQAGHDWPTVRYHLMERNRAYEVQYTLEYLLNLLLIFNPLWLYHYLKGTGGVLRRWRQLDPLQRAMVAIGLGFPLFFLFSTLRGHTQPQWLLPAVFPLMALLFVQDRGSERMARYVRGVGIATMALFLVVRVLAVANPMHLKAEIWDNEESYARIAEVADGRPVQFMHHYANAAKYAYYTGQPVTCAPFFFRRHSQWQYDTVDRAFVHRTVLVGNYTNQQAECIELPNGRKFHYTVVNDFLPMRDLRVDLVGKIDCTVPVDGTLDLTLSVDNPYAFDIYPTEENPIQVLLYFKTEDSSTPTTAVALTDTLRAGTTTVLPCHFTVPASLSETSHIFGFCIGYRSFSPSDNAVQRRVTVSRTATEVSIAE